MLKVFMSYASEDRERVRPFYTRLKAIGTDPWLDVEKILPGQQWEPAIDKAFSSSDVIIIFLTPNSANKRGFVRREANDAISKLREMNADDIYIIPIVLEACTVPDEISKKLQYIDASTETAWTLVEKSLTTAAEQRGKSLRSGEIINQFHVQLKSIREIRNGKPGHDIDITYPEFESATQPLVADELSAFLAGRAAGIASQSRMKSWHQTPEYFQGDFASEGGGASDPAVGRHGRWDSYEIRYASPSFMSINYICVWYGAGAAHQNYFFECYNFAIINNQLIKIDISDFFEDTAEAGKKISAAVVSSIKQQYWDRGQHELDSESVAWITRGAEPGNLLKGSFTINSKGFTFHIPPYEVGPFLMGAWEAEVSFYELREHLIKDGPHILITSTN